MSWKNIIKGIEQYDFYLSKIEELEELLENLHEHIEESAKKMSEATGYDLKMAIALIKSIHSETINRFEDTISEFKEKLEASTKE